MDALLSEHARLEHKGNLKKSIDDVQTIIDLLETARQNVATDPSTARLSLAKLSQPIKKSFERLDSNMKEVHSALGKYGKALDKTFNEDPFLNSQTEVIASRTPLVNRAIALHLLREGQFSVASTFIAEANARPPPLSQAPGASDMHLDDTWEQEFAAGTVKSQDLQRQFHDMYRILQALRGHHDLAPAIAWARAHRSELESRGSNLEFELCRLHFVTLFTSPSGPFAAFAYAHREFGSFHSRYLRDIQQLMGALAFWQNIPESPYRRLFANDMAWEEVASSFTKEFCSLLGLSADSPLYIAATAGAIAIPQLMKLQVKRKGMKTEWSTTDELPVEIPLPPAYHFHSIFVCPVEKVQCTDENPPMMITCGHVISKSAIHSISKGSARFKCPYCPCENYVKDAKQLYL